MQSVGVLQDDGGRGIRSAILQAVPVVSASRCVQRSHQNCGRFSTDTLCQTLCSQV